MSARSWQGSTLGERMRESPLRRLAAMSWSSDHRRENGLSPGPAAVLTRGGRPRLARLRCTSDGGVRKRQATASSPRLPLAAARFAVSWRSSLWRLWRYRRLPGSPRLQRQASTRTGLPRRSRRAAICGSRGPRTTPLRARTGTRSAIRKPTECPPRAGCSRHRECLCCHSEAPKCGDVLESETSATRSLAES